LLYWLSERSGKPRKVVSSEAVLGSPGSGNPSGVAISAITTCTQSPADLASSRGGARRPQEPSAGFKFALQNRAADLDAGVDGSRQRAVG